MPPREFRYQVGDQVRAVTVETAGDRFLVRVGDSALHIAARLGANGRLDLEWEGRRLRAYVARSGQRRYVSLGGDAWTLQPPDPRRAARTGAGPAGGGLTAAMPGRVLDVLVAEGDIVQKGDTLVLLEAMKMELRILAPAAGQVSRVLCSAGQVVERGQVLVEVDDEYYEDLAAAKRADAAFEEYLRDPSTALPWEEVLAELVAEGKLSKEDVARLRAGGKLDADV
jgi:biotin carboxyl carrier protein